MHAHGVKRGDILFREAPVTFFIGAIIRGFGGQPQGKSGEKMRRRMAALIYEDRELTN